MRDYDYFVAHEFTKQKRDDLRRAIDEAFAGTTLRPYYADQEISSEKQILDKIREKIAGSRFGIFDITGGNPNVCLELGIAIGTGKSYHIIAEAGSRIPADLQGFDRISYTSNSQLTSEMREKIAKPEMLKILGLGRGFREEYDGASDAMIRDACSKLYPAVKLEHRFGSAVKDKEASNGKAWFASLAEEQNHIVYGPYEPLQESGNYVAFFRMKASDNTLFGPAFLLDVTSWEKRNDKLTQVASRTVRGIEFDKSNMYQMFGLKFRSKGSAHEYRVLNITKDGQVWIDYVGVIKESTLKSRF